MGVGRDDEKPLRSLRREALATLPRHSAKNRKPRGTLIRLLSPRMPPPWAGLGLSQWLSCGAGGGGNSFCSRGSSWRGKAEGGGPIRTWKQLGLPRRWFESVFLGLQLLVRSLQEIPYILKLEFQRL